MMFLYRNDVHINSGLVSLYMHFDRDTCETSLSTVFAVMETINHLFRNVLHKFEGFGRI